MFVIQSLRSLQPLPVEVLWVNKYTHKLQFIYDYYIKTIHYPFFFTFKNVLTMCVSFLFERWDHRCLWPISFRVHSDVEWWSHHLSLINNNSRKQKMGFHHPRPQPTVPWLDFLSSLTQHISTALYWSGASTTFLQDGPSPHSCTINHAKVKLRLKAEIHDPNSPFFCFFPRLAQTEDRDLMGVPLKRQFFTELLICLSPRLSSAHDGCCVLILARLV